MLKMPARICAIALPVILVAAVLWACAPFLPNWLLGSDEELFRGPTGRFATELDRLRPAGPARFKAALDARLVEAERRDLERALETHGTWLMLRGKVVENVVRLRQEMRHLVNLEDILRFGLTKPGPAPSGLTVVPKADACPNEEERPRGTAP